MQTPALSFGVRGHLEQQNGPQGVSACEMAGSALLVAKWGSNMIINTCAPRADLPVYPT